MNNKALEDIVNFIDFEFRGTNSSVKKRKELLRHLDNLIYSWQHDEFDYFLEYADENKEWDDYRNMNLALQDVPKVWYNMIVKSLGKEFWDEKEKRMHEEWEREKNERAERENARSEGIEVTNDDNDGLPFSLFPIFKKNQIEYRF